ncbi:MAG: hypothetical protein OXQ29_07810 [Rhodospirillaceae bacterium]|nr:hypothetical protein [Rhodospirillaceae bacterium]
MIDPVAIHQLLGATMLGGAIILFGAGYAVLLAVARLKGSALLGRTSLVCYGGLAASTAGLTVLLNLWGWWLALVILLLVGYFIAPRFIWRLSEAVHGDHAESTGETDRE